jgi:hypothetical protein
MQQTGKQSVLLSDQEIVKFYERCPHLILYGLPNVAIQDKWALLALVGYCHTGMHPDWTLEELEGPYKLSLREISTITGVDHTALRKRAGKNAREGVLDRLQKLGYVTTLDARPINEATGKPGREQTYIYIHLRKIWEDNLAFSESHRMPAGKPVSQYDIEVIVDATVDQNNSKEGASTVGGVNVTVDQNNTTADHVNLIVDHNNVTVDAVCSDSAQDYIRPIRKYKDKEEKPSQILEIRSQETRPSEQKLPYALKKNMDATSGEYREYDNMAANRETLGQIWALASTRFDEGTFRIKFDSAKEEASRATDEQLYQMGFPNRSAYLFACLRKRLGLKSRNIALAAG